jgi:hypothetical protein
VQSTRTAGRELAADLLFVEELRKALAEAVGKRRIANRMRVLEHRIAAAGAEHCTAVGMVEVIDLGSLQIAAAVVEEGIDNLCADES